ncbi:MAG: hypothetical protein L6R42_000457 [Xanthoria sp. 1 TBL-2021]|nr:MAG: hypothetical protein L6R42_000457 [Xanthoria sp. 1 TBL-2021]
MSNRCPTSDYVGIARLTHYRWIINRRGYANIVQTDSSSDVVYGLVYSLTGEDEKQLDLREGVRWAYTKEITPIDFWSGKPGERVDLDRTPETKQLLVYIDRKRMDDGVPDIEYMDRVNMGVRGAVQRGMPLTYVYDVIRKSIPAD